jgi:hypothetical protein
VRAGLAADAKPDAAPIRSSNIRPVRLPPGERHDSEANAERLPFNRCGDAAEGSVQRVVELTSSAGLEPAFTNSGAGTAPGCSQPNVPEEQVRRSTEIFGLDLSLRQERALAGERSLQEAPAIATAAQRMRL